MTHHQSARTAVRIACASLGALSALSTMAADLSDRFDLHGYGWQTYDQTSANTYLGADKRGTWDNNFLGLVLAVNLTEQSKLWAQLETSTTGGTAFTWMFVDYQINDQLRAHVGRVKFPLGFYNETIDVKSLQPAALEPMIYQTAADMVHDAYHGVGIDFEQDVGAGHILWQGYAGNTYDTDPPTDSRDRRMAGGRITYRTPVEGLRLMLSAYRTQVELLPSHSMVGENRAIASTEFVRGNWDLKAEYAAHQFNGVNSSGYYVQGAYTLANGWTPYVRYDSVIIDKSQRRDPSFEQSAVVLGIGHKLTQSIGLKAETHFNRGYALPVASGEVEAGGGTTNWKLFRVAVDFIF